MDKLTIDKEKFAYSVLNSISIDSKNFTDEEIAKRQLTLFLTSYYLIDKFNCLEHRDLRNKEDINEILASIKFTQ